MVAKKYFMKQRPRFIFHHDQSSRDQNLPKFEVFSKPENDIVDKKLRLTFQLYTKNVYFQNLELSSTDFHMLTCNGVMKQWFTYYRHRGLLSILFNNF